MNYYKYYINYKKKQISGGAIVSPENNFLDKIHNLSDVNVILNELADSLQDNSTRLFTELNNKIKLSDEIITNFNKVKSLLTTTISIDKIPFHELPLSDDLSKIHEQYNVDHQKYTELIDNIRQENTQNISQLNNTYKEYILFLSQISATNQNLNDSLQIYKTKNEEYKNLRSFGSVYKPILDNNKMINIKDESGICDKDDYCIKVYNTFIDKIKNLPFGDSIDNHYKIASVLFGIPQNIKLPTIPELEYDVDDKIKEILKKKKSSIINESGNDITLTEDFYIPFYNKIFSVKQIITNDEINSHNQELKKKQEEQHQENSRINTNTRDVRTRNTRARDVRTGDARTINTQSISRIQHINDINELLLAIHDTGKEIVKSMSIYRKLLYRVANEHYKSINEYINFLKERKIHKIINYASENHSIFRGYGYFKKSHLEYYKRIIDEILEKKESENGYDIKYALFNVLDKLNNFLEQVLLLITREHYIIIDECSNKVKDIFYTLGFIINLLQNFDAEYSKKVSVIARINDYDCFMANDSNCHDNIIKVLNESTTKEYIRLINEQQYKNLTIFSADEKDYKNLIVREDLCYTLYEDNPNITEDIKNKKTKYSFDRVFSSTDYPENRILAEFMLLPTLLRNGSNILLITLGYSGTGKSVTIFGYSKGKVDGILQATLNEFMSEKIKYATVSTKSTNPIVENISYRVYELYGLGTIYNNYWKQQIDQIIYHHKIEKWDNNNIKVTVKEVNDLSNIQFQNIDQNQLEQFAILTEKIEKNRINGFENVNKDITIKRTENNPLSSRSILFFEFKIKFDKVNQKGKDEVSFCIMDLPGKELIIDSYITNNHIKNIANQNKNKFDATDKINENKYNLLKSMIGYFEYSYHQLKDIQNAQMITFVNKFNELTTDEINTKYKLETIEHLRRLNISILKSSSSEERIILSIFEYILILLIVSIYRTEPSNTNINNLISYLKEFRKMNNITDINILDSIGYINELTALYGFTRVIQKINRDKIEDYMKSYREFETVFIYNYINNKLKELQINITQKLPSEDNKTVEERTKLNEELTAFIATKSKFESELIEQKKLLKKRISVADREKVNLQIEQIKKNISDINREIDRITQINIEDDAVFAALQQTADYPQKYISNRLELLNNLLEDVKLQKENKIAHVINFVLGALLIDQTYLKLLYKSSVNIKLTFINNILNNIKQSINNRNIHNLLIYLAILIKSSQSNIIVSEFTDIQLNKTLKLVNGVSNDDIFVDAMKEPLITTFDLMDTLLKGSISDDEERNYTLTEANFNILKLYVKLDHNEYQEYIDNNENNQIFIAIGKINHYLSRAFEGIYINNNIASLQAYLVKTQSEQRKDHNSFTQYMSKVIEFGYNSTFEYQNNKKLYAEILFGEIQYKGNELGNKNNTMNIENFIPPDINQIKTFCLFSNIPKFTEITNKKDKSKTLLPLPIPNKTKCKPQIEELKNMREFIETINSKN